MVKHLYCNIEYKKQLERIVVVCCHLLILNGNAVAPSLKRRHVTVNSLELSFVLNKFIFFSYVNINIWRHCHSKGARRKMQIDFSNLGSNWDQLWWYSAIYWYSTDMSIFFSERQTFYSVFFSLEVCQFFLYLACRVENVTLLMTYRWLLSQSLQSTTPTSKRPLKSKGGNIWAAKIPTKNLLRAKSCSCERSYDKLLSLFTIFIGFWGLGYTAYQGLVKLNFLPETLLCAHRSRWPYTNTITFILLVQNAVNLKGKVMFFVNDIIVRKRAIFFVTMLI